MKGTVYENGPAYVLREVLKGRSVLRVYCLIGAHPELKATIDLRDTALAESKARAACDKWGTR